MTPVETFLQAMVTAGLVPPATIIADGTLHRFTSNGDHTDDAGWYTYFPDKIPAGVFGCWRLGVKQTWSSKSNSTLTSVERKWKQTRLAEARQQREQDEQLRHADAAQRARAIWEGASPAPANHGYLTKKQIQAHDLRVDAENRLIVPVMIDGTITSLQTIDDAGEKRYLFGGKKARGSFTLGNLSEAHTILICEGYATGASLYEASDFPVVVAFDVGNLSPVAEALRQQYPAAMILLCGDNDKRDNDTPNTGRDAATAAARAIDGILVMPELHGMKCDWNDVHVQCGLDAVRLAIEAAMANEHPAPAITVREAFGGRDGLTKELADVIQSTEYFATDGSGELLVYQDGCYRPGGRDIIARAVKRLLKETGAASRWNRRRVEEVRAYITVDTPVLWERPPLTLLNLLNGLLDVTTGSLLPHTPTHYSPIQIPVRYEPRARCPEWEAFILDVFPEDCTLLAYEIIAWLLRPDTSKQIAFLLRGDGANGKSTFLSALTAMLGERNVSGVSLHALETDKFSTWRLQGKLANICADLPSHHLASTSVFKAIVGGDHLSGERKFGHAFEFVPFARLLFSANHLPQSKDASPAFFRRWEIVPFDRTITEEQRRAKPDILTRLTSGEELSGLLNRCLAVLPALHQRGRFTQTETTASAHAEFQACTDPLTVWIEQTTVVDSLGVLSKKDLYIRYSGEFRTDERPMAPPKTLYLAVKRHYPGIEATQRRINGERTEVFVGVRFRSNPLVLDGAVTGVSGVSASSYLIPTPDDEDQRNDAPGVGEHKERITPDSADSADSPRQGACLACQGTTFWKSLYGVIVCATCHPPSTADVAESWFDCRTEAH